MAHHWSPAYHRTFWQIFLNSSLFSENLKYYWSTFSSSTNHLWNAKPNDQPKKISKEFFFQIIKCVYFFFFFILTPLTFKPHNFLFFYSFSTILLKEHHFKFCKSSLNSNNNIATYKEFFECLGIGLCNIWWFVFWIFNPLYFGGP